MVDQLLTRMPPPAPNVICPPSRIVQAAVNEATILSLVSCRLGVAFVSSATRWRCPESVALLPVTDLKLPLPMALIWRKDNVSPLLEKFVADVRLLPEVEAYSKH